LKDEIEELELELGLDLESGEGLIYEYECEDVVLFSAFGEGGSHAASLMGTWRIFSHKFITCISKKRACRETNITKPSLIRELKWRYEYE